MPLSPERKKEYFAKMQGMLTKYSKILVVHADNVGSSQLQTVRQSLRGEAELLMGKNTMMRLIINDYVKNNPGHPLAKLNDQIIGNVGLFFTNGDLSHIRKLIESNRVPAPARVGAIAPVDVVIPPGATDCDPGQTSFFQVLQIPTKIMKGRIEITASVNLIKTGDKVGPSEAALLQKLKIHPFSYGLTIVKVYDNGSIFDLKVLDLKPEDIQKSFMCAVANIASISLAIGFPTQASVPHSIANAFRNLVSITAQLENYSFKRAEPYKQFLLDPTAFVATVAVEAKTVNQTVTTKVEEKKEEEEEEVAVGTAGLFGKTGDY